FKIVTFISFNFNRKQIGWRTNVKSNEFDVLIFTQRWPLTVCFEWENRSRLNSTHSCVLPKRTEWTIHGIWPTKYNEMGPQFCNRSLSFDSKALAPIEGALKENWIDIHNESKPYSFWKHEWDKHGTCAISVRDLNNELKYFQTGLKLLDKYNMIDVLAKANILPGNKYTVQNYLTGIQRILNKRGQVMCVVDKFFSDMKENYQYKKGITGYIIPPSFERSRLLRVLGLQVKEVPYLQEKFLYTKYVKYNHNNNELLHYS
ncbi:Ribonuclease Oy, partial [Trachymyrmex cornetzi]